MNPKTKNPTAKPTDTLFNFWKNNRLDRHFTLTEEQLKERFTTWIATKAKDWIAYYNTERIIRAFITDDKGLWSVHEEGEFNAMYSLLKPILVKYEKSLQ